MIGILYEKDNVKAYNKLKELICLSENNNNVYKDYINDFLNMLDDKKSCVRVRGFILICVNSKWDNDNIINSNINKVLGELDDLNSTSIRMCLKYLNYLINSKKELKDIIIKKISNINYNNFKESMQKLIKDDVTKIITNY